MAIRNIEDYRIVIPAKADFYENYAKDELLDLYKMATGKTLAVVNDSVLFESNAKIISIGRTNLLLESNVKAEYSALGRDGYRIALDGDSLFLVGGGSYGTVYSVYGFMERQFGYKFYNPDEIYFAKPENNVIGEYDVTEIPTFENRTADN